MSPLFSRERLTTRDESDSLSLRSGERGRGEGRHLVKLTERPPRLLVVDQVLDFDQLPSLLGKGDVLVVNDAATFPGSIHFQRRGLTLEARLFEKTSRGFKAVLFGPGDFRTRTEHRAPPPRIAVGEHLTLAGLSAGVMTCSTPRFRGLSGTRFLRRRSRR